LPMPSYFKPLRRKVGLLTLVMALMFLAAWMRSLDTTDTLARLSASREDVFSSFSGSLVWMCKPHNNPWLSAPVWGWQSLPKERFDLFGHHDISWRWNWMFAGTGNDLTYGQTFRFIQYSLIVIPLALLSAWLLLSKPRGQTIEPNSQTPN